MAILPIKSPKIVKNPEVLDKYIQDGRTALLILPHPIQPVELQVVLECLTPNCFIVNWYREDKKMLLYICSPLFDPTDKAQEYRQAQCTINTDKGMIVDAYIDVPCDDYTMRLRAHRMEFSK